MTQREVISNTSLSTQIISLFALAQLWQNPGSKAKACMTIASLYPKFVNTNFDKHH